MNVLRAIKVAELRKKLSVIPVKLIFAAAVLFGFMLHKSGCIDMNGFSITGFSIKSFIADSFDPSALLLSVKTDYQEYLAAFLALYGIISYFVFFMQLLKHWLPGLVIGVGVAAVILAFTGKYNVEIMYLCIFVMLLLGPLFDLINFFRYKGLKHKVIQEEEEMKKTAPGDSYNDGFEEGYKRGVREGKRASEETYAGGCDDRISEEKAPRIKKAEFSQNDDEDYIAENGDNSEDWDSADTGYRESGDTGHGDFSNEKNDSEGRININADSSNIHGYFADCHNSREIKRRYHDLCKVYHPDSGNAGSDIFCKINEEYKSLMNENDNL